MSKPFHNISFTTYGEVLGEMCESQMIILHQCQNDLKSVVNQLRKLANQLEQDYASKQMIKG